MSTVATRMALVRLAAPLRVRTAIGWACLGLGLGTLVLGGAAWAVRLGWLHAPYWVLVAWAGALATLLGAAFLAGKAQVELTPGALAGHLEALGAWRTGSLTALLDGFASGTSESLLGQADQAGAADLARRGADAIVPLARPVRGVVLVGCAALMLGLAAFASADPVGGPAAALWHPRRAWEATVAPVRIHLSRETVDRGESVDFQIEAVGRRRATLWVRSPGEAWRPRVVPLDSLGRATLSSGPLLSDLYARATSGSRTSDTVLVHIRLPVFLGGLRVTAHYPPYLHLESEPVPTGGDTLLLPAGTRLETRGEATAVLSRASWSLGSRSASLATRGGQFSGSFIPVVSGEYRLRLATATGAPMSSDTVRLPIRLVADSVPRVEVPVPGVDTIAPLGLQVPLVLDIRDDHGLTAAAVVSRRISRFGIADSARVESLPLPPNDPDRAILTHTLDLTRRGLLPGDTVRYGAVATDNTPQHQAGRSKEYVLRLPTMSEIRAAQRQASRSVAGRLDSVSAASARLSRQTEDLARERPRAGDGGAENTGRALSFEEAKRAESVARSQQDLVKQAEVLKESLEALRKGAEAAGLGDSAWQRQLAEIRDQIERALSPELRERLAALQQALRELDADRARDALERLVEAQRELREALERSRELFRRAAVEGDLANLSKEAKELVEEQHRWNDAVSSADSSLAVPAERELAGRTDSLAAALDRLEPAMDDAERQQRFEALSREAQAAGRAMRRAAESSQQGRRQDAKRHGEAAARSLEPMGDQLVQERASLQGQWRQEVLQALDQALTETGRLSERQLAVQEALQSRGEVGTAFRAEQGAIEEGVQRLLEQLRQAAGKNALIPPAIGAALGSAQLRMQRAREAIGSANPDMGAGAEQAAGAVAALNATAYQLARARGDVSGSSSGTGLAEALERMAQLAQQQGGIGQEAGGLLPMTGSAAIGEQLRRLAARQQALADALEKLKAEGSLPGASELAEEARDLARRMEAGRLDRQIVERQERLFRRMLDAGRTLQGREEDERKERQSATAGDDSVHLPPALRAKLLGDADRLRAPTWEELQRLSPEERRLVVDYFRRLSEPPVR